MDLSRAENWSPPEEWRRITVIDSHTGGEPFRVILDGLPDVQGLTVLERRRYASRHLDGMRRLLMWEPRGHADMYGGIVGPPQRADSDVSVLFIHNEGFSTMCGHGIIALTKVLLDTGALAMTNPTTTIKIDTPAGQIVSTATIEAGKVRSVTFRNVASFVIDLDSSISVPGLGQVGYDLAFGGAFYAYVDATTMGLSLDDAGSLIDAGRLIKEAITAGRSIDHPVEAELGFLYGVIFTGQPNDPSHHSRNVCVFADGEIDRSPTGTGVSGRLAIAHRRGEIALGETFAIESIVGSIFTGTVVEETSLGPYPAVIPEVSGTAHITGRTEFWVDPDDIVGAGFLLR